MQIDRDIFPYIVYSHDSIGHALRKISANRAQLVYALSEHGALEGVFTDGDFRRWVVEQAEINLDDPVSVVANKAYTWASVREPEADLAELLSDRIKSVPLVDERHHLVAILWRETSSLSIDGRRIGDNDDVFVVAEIGNNHNGDVERALQLVQAAEEAGADAVKLQLRTMRELYIDEDAARRQGQDLGTEYTLDLLTRFQLSDDEMFGVFNDVKRRGLVPLCTPWDLSSLEKLRAYGLGAIKIASADLTNHELLQAGAAAGLPMLISTGMSTEAEIVEAIQLLDRLGARYLLLHCNSTYPTAPRDVNLTYLRRLRDLSGRPVGYSGHELGWAIAVGAVAMGARLIEKHVTLDRSLEGNDHRVSLLPDELALMVSAIRTVDEALGESTPRVVSQGERLNREVLGKSLVAAVEIHQDERITADKVVVRSPGRGLNPTRKSALVGLRSQRHLLPGDFFYESDIRQSGGEPRSYSFSRRWGLPVRYHDYLDLASRSNPDLLEFHLSYRDMQERPARAVPEPIPLGLVVHAPELFAGDHLLDLASEDDAYRKRSIAELQSVVETTLELRERFQSDRVPIIVNVGGFSRTGPRPSAWRPSAYERVAIALEEVDQPGIELLPQTAPPFPWHFGGQQFHNLFVAPEDVDEFCTRYERRVCLDVSHTGLAAHHLGRDPAEVVAIIAPHTMHLHLADAAGTDGEGLPIGDGDLDFAAVAEALSANDDATFIPEIWQGHKNGGEGFWVALSQLEAWF